MSYLQALSDQASLPSIVIIFLLAGIAGWCVGNLIQWFRR